MKKLILVAVILLSGCVTPPYEGGYYNYEDNALNGSSFYQVQQRNDRQRQLNHIHTQEIRSINRRFGNQGLGDY